jgi:hypothetical protein
MSTWGRLPPDSPTQILPDNPKTVAMRFEAVVEAPKIRQ